MSDEIVNDKWADVEKHLAKKEQHLPQPASNPITPQVIHGTGAQPQGIVERFKSNKIERNKRIEILTETTKGQLQVWKHYVEGQVVVSKQRIDTHVEAQLMEIGRQHLMNLQEIGISNFDDRFRALQELTRRSASQIEQVNSMDVPPTMKQKLIEAVVKGYEQLFDKIQSEEIRAPRKD
jgi:hypothetical protein